MKRIIPLLLLAVVAAGVTEKAPRRRGLCFLVQFA